MSLNGHTRSMIVTLNTPSLSCLAEVRAFLDGNAEVGLSPPPQADRHTWLAATLRQFHCGTLKRPDKGLVRAFALKVTGYSRAQLTRLIRQWQRDRRIVDRRGPPAQPFARRYTEADVRALVTLDGSWPALRTGHAQAGRACLQGLLRSGLRAPGQDL